MLFGITMYVNPGMLLKDNRIKMATEQKMKAVRYGNPHGHFSSCFYVQNHFGVLYINVL
jgi:hypothetical protein